MIRAGIDRKIAKEISGHESDSIFDRYNIVSESDLNDAMAKRAAYEAEISKAVRDVNANKEPAPFRAATSSPQRGPRKVRKS
jgi:hypothetical protein